VTASPFHDGERAVQERIGVRERLERVGPRMVRDFMPDEHRQFFEDLPFVVVGSADANGAIWASLLAGEPGFVRAPTPRRLQVEAVTLPGDPLATNIAPRAPLGLLGIELATRRRNRVNGLVERASGGSFELKVDQSFGNCKQYIQSRVGLFAPVAARRAPRREGASLSNDAQRLLARTDTAFIASGSRHPAQGGSEGLDISHRGGLPGFIHAESRDGATWLTLPDYYGNFMFNTFGNLEVNPHAGLLALDFAAGDVLSLSGRAQVVWSGPALSAFAGAQRLLELRVDASLLWRAILQDWSPPELSRQLLELTREG
jgi:predicted pyridoxine 5'-phosphate oxidase superfamily flavin-nucleotide-binding protein